MVTCGATRLARRRWGGARLDSARPRLDRRADPPAAHALTLPLGAAGLALAWAIDPAILPDHLIGAAIGFAAFAGIAALYRRLRGRDGLGLGDAKLLAALGAWVGWQGLPTIVLYAAGTALLWALTRSLIRPGGHTQLHAKLRLPFGPFLCLAGWFVWLYGPLMLG